LRLGAIDPVWRFVLTRKQILTYYVRMVSTCPQRDVFRAISHPTRREILDLLAEGDRSVNSVAAHFKMSRPAVSQHLRILLDAGLVTEQRHGRERRYHFVPEQLGPVWNWVSRYRAFWEERVDRLEKLLDEMDP
jgi:DNA-binding transcriptional ArsR family regulator